MKTKPALRGVFCASLTPVNADFTLHRQAFTAHCQKLLKDGLTGIALLGTTGEANSFSVAERQIILETALQAGIDPSRLLPGTGVSSLADSVTLTRHAASLGVKTTIILPPFYYKNVSDDGLYGFYANIVERVADPDLQIILYHIPQFSGVEISFGLIESLLKKYPDTFIGVKDSSGNLDHMLEMVRLFPEFSVFSGADPLMLPLLQKGGAGAITATTNIVGAELAFVFNNFDRPEAAADLLAAQARVIAARNEVSRFHQMASLKEILARQTGLEVWRHMLPPLCALSAAQREALLSPF